MFSFTQDIVSVVITVICSLLFMAMLNRIWPWEKRRAHNDLIGWQLSILGTTYAVILGFMLYTVWTNFGEADLNVDLEANALVNVYRLAEGLPDPQHQQLEGLARSYADAAINVDWPEMINNRVPNTTVELNRQMWKLLMSVKTATPTQLTAEDHALYELSTLTEHRRTRVLESTARLPKVLWCVLIIGGLLTIVSSSMFGAENYKLHGLQVFAFSLLIALVLVAIANINQPFQGSVHVSDYAFRRALENMQNH